MRQSHHTPSIGFRAHPETDCNFEVCHHEGPPHRPSSDPRSNCIDRHCHQQLPHPGQARGRHQDRGVSRTLPPPAPVAGSPSPSSPIDNLPRLQNVLWNLNKIALDHGGNRAFGEPGYKASLDFILERAQTRFHDEFDTFVQPFNHTYDKTLKISVTGPEGDDVFVVSPQYNPPTPEGGVTAGLIDTPVDAGETGSMCVPEQWAGIDATGKIALVKRGICGVAEKLKLARQHGALGKWAEKVWVTGRGETVADGLLCPGVIVYNQDPGTNYPVPTLQAENIGKMVPSGIIPLDVAESWRTRLAAGEDVVVTLLVDAISETRETWNIISETKKGDPNKVIMLGAHLDSVQAGAGINDDGSGTAALLEIMTAVRYYEGYPHKIRFGWWGAEESGLVGSLYYTSHLSTEEVSKIKYYFNYDMIGSPNPVFEVSIDENSGIGPQLLEDYLVAQGKNVTHA